MRPARAESLAWALNAGFEALCRVADAARDARKVDELEAVRVLFDRLIASLADGSITPQMLSDFIGAPASGALVAGRAPVSTQDLDEAGAAEDLAQVLAELCPAPPDLRHGVLTGGRLMLIGYDVASVRVLSKLRRFATVYHRQMRR